jgi:hypothetical protein
MARNICIIIFSILLLVISIPSIETTFADSSDDEYSYDDDSSDDEYSYDDDSSDDEYSYDDDSSDDDSSDDYSSDDEYSSYGLPPGAGPQMNTRDFYSFDSDNNDPTPHGFPSSEKDYDSKETYNHGDNYPKPYNPRSGNPSQFNSNERLIVEDLKNLDPNALESYPISDLSGNEIKAILNQLDTDSLTKTLKYINIFELDTIVMKISPMEFNKILNKIPFSSQKEILDSIYLKKLAAYGPPVR